MVKATWIVKHWPVCAAAVLASPLCLAATMEQFRTLDAPAQFLREESFAAAPGCPLPEFSLTASGLGEFKFAASPADKTGHHRVRFFPPTYKQKLTWSRRCGEKRLTLKSVRYKSPAPYLDRKIVHSFGSCQFPFVMGNSFVEDGPLRNSRFAVAWNTLGEAVWAYSKSFESSTNERNAVMMSEASTDEWAFLSRQADTTFTWMKKDGRILQQLNFREKGLPANGQGFRFDPSTRHLDYFGFECDHARKDPDGPTYRGRKLLDLNLENMSFSTLWRSFDQFDPKTTPNRYISSSEMDPYPDLTDPELRRRQLQVGTVWYDWPDKLCNADWSHENSVDFHPARGYLISSRNLNKLTIFNPASGKGQVIGAKPGCDLCLDAELSFSGQHAARFLDRDHILMYDNHVPGRGVLGERSANHIMLLKLHGVPATSVTIEKSVPIPGLFSLIRGNAETMPNGDWFVYNPGNAGAAESFLEFSPLARKFQCRVDFQQLGSSRQIEARAFSSLIGETWSPPAAAAEKKRPGWIDESVNDIMY